MKSFDLNEIDSFNWQPFKEGVEQFSFQFNSEQKENGTSARLLRYKNQAKVPFHTHPGYEHIITLSGSQTDRSGVSKRGMLIINKPKSGHSLVSDEGCIVLAIYEKPVCFCNESDYSESKKLDDYFVFQDLFDTSALTRLSWEPAGKGLNQHVFYEHKQSNEHDKAPSAKLIQCEPMTSICENISESWRYVLYVSGGVNQSAGLLEIYPPGSKKQRADNSEGCIALYIEVFE